MNKVIQDTWKSIDQINKEIEFKTSVIEIINAMLETEEERLVSDVFLIERKSTLLKECEDLCLKKEFAIHFLNCKTNEGFVARA